MLANQQLKVRTSPEVKLMLYFLAQREGRSQSNMVRTLIVEKYQSLKAAEQAAKKQPTPAA